MPSYNALTLFVFLLLVNEGVSDLLGYKKTHTDPDINLVDQLANLVHTHENGGFEGLQALTASIAEVHPSTIDSPTENIVEEILAYQEELTASQKENSSYGIDDTQFPENIRQTLNRVKEMIINPNAGVKSMIEIENGFQELDEFADNMEESKLKYELAQVLVRMYFDFEHKKDTFNLAVAFEEMMEEENAQNNDYKANETAVAFEESSDAKKEEQGQDPRKISDKNKTPHREESPLKLSIDKAHGISPQLKPLPHANSGAGYFEISSRHHSGNVRGSNGIHNIGSRGYGLRGGAHGHK